MTPTDVRAAPGSKTERARAPELDRVAVRSGAVDTDALVPELRLRRPDLDFEASRQRRRDAAMLTIERGSTGLRLELTTTDGQTYVRDVPADDDIGSRAVAADTTAFLNAVERGAVSPEPKRKVGGGRNSKDEPQRLGDRLAEALVLGAGLGPAVTVPLAGNPSFRAGSFFSGHLVLRAQTLRGVMFELGTRVGGKRALDHRLARGRIGFGAGYRLQRDKFDMPITGALTIEPWSVQPRTSNAPDLEAQGVPLTRPASMVGFAVRAVPAALLQLPRGIAMRVGGGVELAVSGIRGTGGGAVRVMPRDGSDTAFRVSGLEATFLAEIGVWVPWTSIRRKPAR